MVYCGRPSKSCQFCRRRRIKVVTAYSCYFLVVKFHLLTLTQCDLRPLGCSQCAKASMDCPGYRNQLDLIFRDESDNVVRKAQRTSGSSKAAATSSADKRAVLSDKSVLCLRQKPQCIRATKTGEALGSTELVPMGIDVSSILKSLSQPIQDRANCFLLNSYVDGSHFEYLREICNMGPVDELLSTSVEAVGLASLSHETNCHDTWALASRRYVSALQLANFALQSESQSLKDSTLVAILLLGLFEITVSENQSSYAPWTHHIDGATSLFILRGPRQFESSMGLKIFNHINSCVLVSANQRGVRVSPEFKALKAYATRYIDATDPVSRFFEISEQFAELRASIGEGRLCESAQIIKYSKGLDDQIQMLVMTLPAHWKYETIFIPMDSKLVYGDHYHIYPDHQRAQYWNSIRMTRLILNEMIHNRITDEMLSGHFIPPAWLELLSQTVQTAAEMAAEICASVPQFTQHPSPTGPRFLSPKSCVVAQGYFLLWPLSIAGEARLTPEPIRVYVIDRLRYIGYQMKIPHALSIAQEIEDGKRLTNKVLVRKTQKSELTANSIATARFVPYHLPSTNAGL
jgi:Fungal specific transcription factor domain